MLNFDKDRFLRIEAGAPVLVVGAGVMGAGIAQVAAQAGHPVQIFDARKHLFRRFADVVGKIGEVAYPP